MTTIELLASDVESARQSMDYAWKLYQAKQECARLMARYVRSLRRMERLRDQMLVALAGQKKLATLNQTRTYDEIPPTEETE